jgi:uncharacterized Zn-finger protein
LWCLHQRIAYRGVEGDAHRITPSQIEVCTSEAVRNTADWLVGSDSRRQASTSRQAQDPATENEPAYSLSKIAISGVSLRFNDPDHYDHHLICLTNYKIEQNSRHVSSMFFNCVLASWNKLILGVSDVSLQDVSFTCSDVLTF